jgi:short subunit dehydrogenase-like uncharacterized protein
MSKVLILGGYGYFGKRIAHLLTRHNVPVIIAGRDAEKVGILARTLPAGLAETAVFDARQTLSAQLKALSPTVVINTCGPFQTSDYAVAETCIRHGAHYIDLADARDFVTSIPTLDGEAKGNTLPSSSNFGRNSPQSIRSTSGSRRDRRPNAVSPRHKLFWVTWAEN